MNGYVRPYSPDTARFDYLATSLSFSMQLEGEEIAISGAITQDAARVLGLELNPDTYLDTSFSIPIWIPWPDDQINALQIMSELLVKGYTLESD